MKVILQKQVANLGKVGAQVTVRPGYGRNYLIPFGFAVPATSKNIAAFEARRAEFEKAEQEVLASAQARAEQLAQATLIIERVAGDEGKLFGSIGPRDIAEAANAMDIDLSKWEVILPEGPIRQVGQYPVTIKLHSEVVTIVQVHVVGKKSQSHS